ncbi:MULTISPECIES: hypothetical protein [Shewanella]|uniref:Uncharacterized protein n=1 Tax=Shewanella indica TaxID=768528 RepID=A0ABU4QCL6_9GAMM|nr:MULTISPECIES: hypothetical protein [Shewanella]MDX6015086.1 hypothetical protein [Shewanella indica]NDO74760.1 hypothetical protein [Shewanella sp. SE1]
MSINDDHLYHGAALTQIAEHPQFTAINAFRDGKKISRSSFLINQDIAVYLKYASKPTGRYKEYIFNFRKEHLEEIEEIEKRSKKALISLVCVQDREICLFSRSDLMEMIEARIREKGSEEDVYTVIVVAPKGKSLRLYMNAPGVKGTKLSEKIISRNLFPNKIFEESDNA